MLLVLASALKAEAKPSSSVTGTFFFNNMADDSVNAKSFTIEPSSISEMKVEDSREIHIKIEPEGAIKPEITPSYDDVKDFIELSETSYGYKITAKQESDRTITIAFQAEGLKEQTLTIEKITPKEVSSPKTEEKLATDFILNKHSFNTLQIGGTGVDFAITPKPADGKLGEVSFTINPPGVCKVTKNTNGSYHITAEKQSESITITIMVDGINGIVKTIKINKIVANTTNDTNKGQSSNTDVNNDIKQLKTRIQNLKEDSIQCHKSIAQLSNDKESLNNNINQLKEQLREIGNNKPTISTTLAIIIGIVGTLIIAIIVFIILYKKLEKIFYEDLKDAEKETYELRRQLNDNHSDKNIKEKRLKELEGEIDKFKKENDSLKMEIMHLQKNSSKVQSTTNQEIVENQPVIDNNPPTPEPPRNVSMYSDCIIDGYFNRVSERPDEDTVFKLVLDDENMNMASVDVYQGAHRRIIANPAFIDGCEKQIVGNSNVRVERKGIAEKDADNGKWRLIKAPMIEIR